MTAPFELLVDSREKGRNSLGLRGDLTVNMPEDDKQKALAVESKTDKRKQSLYFPETMLEEIKLEAHRLNRSLSWVVQRAWKVARKDVKKLPGVNEAGGQ